MRQELQKKIDKLKTSSALTFDEMLDLLTGKTPDQIERSRVQAKPPKDPNTDPGIRPVKFLKDVLGDPESGAYNITGARIVIDRDVGDLMAEHFGDQVEIRADQDATLSPLSCEKAGRAFGYEPQYVWTETDRHAE